MEKDMGPAARVEIDYVELQVTIYPHMEKKEDHAVKESIGAADTSLRITSALLVPSYIILGLSDQLICWCTAGCCMPSLFNSRGAR